MLALRKLTLLSFIGSTIVGFWVPLHLIGHIQWPSLELSLNIVTCLVALINLKLHFQRKNLSPLEFKNWLNLGVLLDTLCALPIFPVAFYLEIEVPILFSIINLSAVRHVGVLKEYLDHFDHLSPMSYRLIPIFLTLPLLVHMVACGWLALGNGTAGLEADPLTNYIKAIYFTFTTLTTVGYGDISAKTNPQMLYAAAIQVTGVGVFGYILSNVASILGRSDAAREHHMDNLDKIETFMDLHRIPEELKIKTRSYYHYLWLHKKGYQENTLLSDLPHKLQSEMLYYINNPIIQKVSFLKSASQDMLEDLMDKLEPKIVLPNERIFRIDEPGDSLYFIQSGEVDILARDGSLLATLSDGAFFGEMALLNEKPRNATVKARSFCSLYLLHKRDFVHVIEAYPEFRSHLTSAVNQRQSA